MPIFDTEWFAVRTVVDPVTNCWNWQLSHDGTGGGVVGQNYQTFKAYRCAYESFVGPIPTGMWVLHSCDNRACCNPTHLRIGTPQANSADMVERGRSAAGIKNGMHTSSLDSVKVLAIRASPLPNVQLAKLYSVTPSMIGRIKKRLTWKHV